MRLSPPFFRHSAEVLFLFCLSQLLGCGSTTFVGGAIHPSNVIVTNGTVSFVALSVVSGDNGTFVNVTGVTLLEPLGTSSLTFCGDQRPSFIMNTTVQVSFTSGQSCSTLMGVMPI
jgi:hypothetical protein